MIASANLTRRSLRQQAREDIAGYLFLLPWIIGFLVFHAGAIFASFGLSLFDTDLLSPAKFIGLGNYLEMFFEDPLFWQSLKVSALYTLGSVPLQMLLGLGLALLLNQRVAGRGFWRTVFYLPSVVSGVAIAMIWSWFYHPDLGLFNNALLSIGIEGPRWLFSEVWALPSLILMNVWSVGPVMLIFLAGLQSIQKEFYEAAQIDGAGRRQQFWRITVPILSPQILFNTVLGIIGSFQVFTTAFVMTEGGPNNATRTLVLHMYSRGFLSVRFGYSAALACILFVLLLVFIVFVLRSSRSAVFYEAQ